MIMVFFPLSETFTWAKAATSGTLPSPRDSHSMSSWNNKLFVLGGEDGSNSFLADAYVLDAGKRIMIPLSHKFFFRVSKIGVFICIYTRAMLIKFYVHVFIKGVKHF